jgi:hypothetical protein
MSPALKEKFLILVSLPKWHFPMPGMRSAPGSSTVIQSGDSAWKEHDEDLQSCAGSKLIPCNDFVFFRWALHLADQKKRWRTLMNLN